MRYEFPYSFSAPDPSAGDCFARGGEMSRHVGSVDWNQTALGPITSWPQSLRTSVSICLASRFPIVLYWGSEFISIYNDSYSHILAAKHPWALGRPCAEVWSEIWDVIGPMLNGVVASGEATWSDDQLLILHRHGYDEECYFSFSFSPVRNETGAVGGIFTAVTENTQRVIGERRLEVLRKLGARTAEARTPEDACRLASEILSGNSADLPFVLIYLLDGTADCARLASAAGLQPGELASPIEIDLQGEGAVTWPVARVARAGASELITDAIKRFAKLPGGPWPESPHSVFVTPIGFAAGKMPAGVLVAGINPRRAFDDSYQGFVDLVAGQIATSIANGRAYEEERKRAQALAELDRAKTAFFSNVSHEFRTPLTLILGPLEDTLNMDAGAVPQQIRGQLEIAHRNALRLLKLVNTVLDFSRIEAGRIEAVYESVDLAVYTSELASVFRSAIEKAGLRFVIDCQAMPEPIYVDREMWEKIVLNLISNAFKFTLAGEIQVKLHWRDSRAELIVRDTGTGIPEQELSNVFKRFHRVRGSRARTHEGSGIGLSLVQELVRLHGGTVEVASVLGEGTTFRLSIPSGRAHLPPERIERTRKLTSTALGAAPYLEEASRWHSSPDTGPSQQTEQFSSLAGQSAGRILVADDNEDMREYIRRLLCSEYSVETAADGQSALTAARERPPDLVLTDVMMPGLDGFELLREMRTDSRLRDIPVVMLSARAGEEARVEGIQSGADDYLVKPFAARELIARVRAHLELRRLRNAADRRKDEFLAMLAHELRNPLAPIRNAVAILRRIGPPEPQLDWARALIDRQLDHLTRLVDDLLDISRITHGKIMLQKDTVDIATVVQRALETSRPLVEAGKHALRVELPVEPLCVEGDPTRLAQVLANLLNNAAKYTPESGQITISAQRDGNEAVVRVCDTGEGIASDVLPHIFDLFTQAHRSLDRSQGGLGIGLTLVRTLVQMHGGTVEVFSAGPGRGCEFVVRLPALASAFPLAEVPQGLAGNELSAGLQIFVVDDNIDNADSLAFLLEDSGHRVHLAHDGPTALELAKLHQPQMILLDLGLPELDGFEVARRLREMPNTSKSFLVAVTGYGQDKHRQQTKDAGFDYHMVKPIEWSELLEIIRAIESSGRIEARSA